MHAPLYAFPGLRQVLRGLQSESDFLKNNMVRLCCPKGISEQYQGDAKVFEPANGTLSFEEAKKSLSRSGTIRTSTFWLQSRLC